MRRPSVVICLLVAVATAAVAAAPRGASGPAPDASGGRLQAPGPSFMLARAAVPSVPLRATGRRALRASSWWGGTYRVSTGESVTVYVSAAYPVDDAAARRWADFLASLLHGEELSALRAYIAPLREVEEFCGSDGVLGCYGGNRMISIGETVGGVTPEEVVRHEYGHHVAANRRNPPWSAVAWGTKRWASYQRVCSRVATGTAFPGDQDAHYTLNPGEAFAEAYRVLTEVRGGSPAFTWSLADVSFRPDRTALARVEEDVLRPWSPPAPRLVASRVPPGRSAWSVAIATPLDGELEATLTLAAGAAYELSLLSGKTVVARGLWSGTRKLSLRYTVCGQRALTLRVVRAGGSRRFSIRISSP